MLIRHWQTELIRKMTEQAEEDELSADIYLLLHQSNSSEKSKKKSEEGEKRDAQSNNYIHHKPIFKALKLADLTKGVSFLMAATLTLLCIPLLSFLSWVCFF